MLACDAAAAVVAAALAAVAEGELYVVEAAEAAAAVAAAAVVAAACVAVVAAGVLAAVVELLVDPGVEFVAPGVPLLVVPELGVDAAVGGAELADGTFWFGENGVPRIG